MRCFAHLAAFAALLLLLAPAGSAFAGGGEPMFGAEGVILTDEDLSGGWKLGDLGEDIPAGLPTEDELTEIAGDAVDSFGLTMEHRPVVAPGGENLVVAIVDVDVENPKTYLDALEAAASSKGWRVGTLGHPKRVLVVAGPAEPAATLEKLQKKAASKNLCLLGFEAILSDFDQGTPSAASVRRAKELVNAGVALFEATGTSRTLLGIAKIFEKDEAEGISQVKEGLASPGSFGANQEIELFANNLVARTYFQKKESSADEKAVDWFRKAIAQEKYAIERANKRNDAYLRLRVWGSRFYLVGTLSRLGRLEEAFTELEPCLEVGKRLVGGQWQQFFEQVWYWSEDVKSMREDARFMELCKKHAPDKYDFEKRRPELDKQRKKRDEAIANAKKQEEERKKREAEKKDDDKGDDVDG